MTLTGFPFVLDPADKHRLLTLEEHEGLCCLLDRARHYGGAGDIAFLCMSTCSLLVRFAPEKTGTWTVCGYAFQKAQEPWVWAYLPSLPGTLLAPPSGKLLFHAERADTADVWLERHDPSLSHGARQLARDTARLCTPTTAFTGMRLSRPNRRRNIPSCCRSRPPENRSPLTACLRMKFALSRRASPKPGASCAERKNISSAQWTKPPTGMYSPTACAAR